MKKSLLLLTLVLITSINCFGQTGIFERSKEGEFTFEHAHLSGVVPDDIEEEVALSLQLKLIRSEPKLKFFIARYNNRNTCNYILINGYRINIVDIIGFTITTPSGSIICKDFNNKQKGDVMRDEFLEEHTYNELNLKLSQTDLKILRNLPNSGFKLEMLVNHYNNSFQSIELKPNNLTKVSAILSNSVRQLEILKDLNL